jgi:hypothetical protein
VDIKPGARLKSQVDGTEVIVVRAPEGEATITCGGHPMVARSAGLTTGLSAVEDGESVQMGKRYFAPDVDGLEVLVTKAGGGALGVNGTPMVIKAAKPLPSSD